MVSNLVPRLFHLTAVRWKSLGTRLDGIGPDGMLGSGDLSSLLGYDERVHHCSLTQTTRVGDLAKCQHFCSPHFPAWSSPTLRLLIPTSSAPVFSPKQSEYRSRKLILLPSRHRRYESCTDGAGSLSNLAHRSFLFFRICDLFSGGWARWLLISRNEDTFWRQNRILRCKTRQTLFMSPKNVARMAKRVKIWHTWSRQHVANWSRSAGPFIWKSASLTQSRKHELECAEVVPKP